jgi:hypothetical protein
MTSCPYRNILYLLMNDEVLLLTEAVSFVME